MSQCNVERVIGRLLTDEGFRRRFGLDPEATLLSMVAAGLDLNRCERTVLAALDAGWLNRFAEELDSRIQKVEIQGEPK